MSEELKRYCPSIFTEEGSYEFFAQVKRRIELLSELAKKGNFEDDRLTLIDKYFAEQSLPMCFDVDSLDNVILQAEVGFEDLCAVLQSNGVQDAKDLTTKQFYLRLEYFKKEAAKIKAATKTGSA